MHKITTLGNDLEISIPTIDKEAIDLKALLVSQYLEGKESQKKDIITKWPLGKEGFQTFTFAKIQ